MMELKIGGVVYEFNFGMGFMRELNKRISAPVDGLKDVTKNIGLQYKLSGLFDGDLEDLVDILDIANKGCVPRVTREMLDDYIDNECEDIDSLFDDVMGFLGKANATKKAMETLKMRAEQMKAQNQ